MISPKEIKLQALKWWEPFLQSHVANETFFPKQITRIGKVKPSHVIPRFEALQNEMEDLYKHSKNETGIGYLVKTAGNNFRRTGTHELPDAIEFETENDYLHFTEKKHEWEIFLRNYKLVIKSLPQLKEWVLDNTTILTTGKDWKDILKVCHYFIDTPRPNLYLRQLPIRVHTKFIEENTALFHSLLGFLIPGHIRNEERKKIAERYFLKHDEPIIRVRILDPHFAIASTITDLGIKLSDFESMDWQCDHVLIAENKMNFLTLPPFPSGMGIWSGGGFNVSYLRNAGWLNKKNIYYWGDIDEHGFQILDQLRGYYPHTKSVMMDIQTYGLFKDFAVKGERSHADTLQFLNNDEAALYNFLKGQSTNNRLEQEKITQDYAEAEIAKLL